MPFEVSLLEQAHQALVEPIASYGVISDVVYLDKAARLDLAQRQVECAASPVENEREATLQLSDAPPMVLAAAKVSVEGRQWLMYELMDVEAGELSGPSICPSPPTV